MITVAELWRHPVKSMGGERLDSVAVDARGIHADRLWAVKDLELGAVTTGRRLPMLLQLTARFDGEPPADAGPGRAHPAIVTFPDGEELRTGDPRLDARLCELTGKRVALVPLPAREDKAGYRGVLATQSDIRRQFEIPDDEPLPDLTMFPLRKLAELARYATPIGMFADAYPLHILTRASLQLMALETPATDFDVRRFRPSVLLETGGDPGLEEFGWLGGTLTLGSAVARAEVPTIRCSMPTRVQPGLDADADVIRTVRALADRCLGVYADVERSGRVAVGDVVRFAKGEPPSTLDRARDGLRGALVRTGGKLMPRG